MKKYTFRNYVEYMQDNPKGLWFKMRLYGWGWIPVRWQGWIVVLAFVAIFILNGFYFVSSIPYDAEPSILSRSLFFGVMIVSVIALILICYKKGERPKWSWGRD